MRTRTATEADFERIFALGCAMREESRVPFPPLKKDLTRSNFLIMLGQPTQFCCVVAEDDVVCGMMVGFKAGFLFSPEGVAAHDIYYVAPEYRATKAGRMLAKALIEWANANGCRYTRLGVHTGLNLDKVDRFYRRLGFVPMGGEYLRDNQCVSPPSLPP